MLQRMPFAVRRGKHWRSRHGKKEWGQMGLCRSAFVRSDQGNLRRPRPWCTLQHTTSHAISFSNCSMYDVRHVV